MTKDKLYRPNVGIAVFNRQGKVLICKWDTNNWDNDSKRYCWQMPQGGVDNNEDPLETAYRELKEETNIEKHSLKLLKKASKAYKYDFPKGQKGTTHDGQKQTWFAFEFIGHDDEVDVINCPDQCFVEWRWEELENLISLITPFKKEVYQKVVEEFKEFSKGF